MAGGARHDLAHQLAAGRVDVLAAGFAGDAHDAPRQQHLPETLDDLGRRAAIRALRDRVEGDQIDLGRDPAQALYQLARAREVVVDPIEHDIFEGDAGVGGLGVAPAGGQSSAIG